MSATEARAYARSLLGAVAVGLVVAPAALAFVALTHLLEGVLWHDLPEWIGAEQPPSWLVVLIPALGGLLTAAAMHLRGGGGHAPLDGLIGDPIRLPGLASALAAALASLSFGAVLGPEAPLMAIGSAVGLWLANRLGARPADEPLWLYGGMLVALGTILGNPLNSVILIAEVLVVTVGARLFHSLLPALVAAGVGYLFFVGVGPFVGVEGSSLTVSVLPVPETLGVADLLLAPVIGVAVAGLSLGMLMMMSRLAPRMDKTVPSVRLPVVGAAVGLLAVVFSQLTGRPAQEMLFSGQTELDSIVTAAAVGTLLAYLVLKGLAYVLSAAAGFRGGLLFPLIAISVALGAIAAEIVPGLSTGAAASAAIAAALAGGLRLPFSGVLFAVLLLGPAGAPLTPVAIFSAAAAFVVSEWVHRMRGVDADVSST